MLGHPVHEQASGEAVEAIDECGGDAEVANPCAHLSGCTECRQETGVAARLVRGGSEQLKEVAGGDDSERAAGGLFDVHPKAGQYGLKSGHN